MKRIYKNILKNNLISLFISLLIFLYLHLVYFTSKKSFAYNGNSKETIYQNTNGVLIAFWHNRIALIPFIAKLTPHISVYILHSGHRDGTIIKNIMHLFNFKTIAGSSAKGGFRALKEILTTLKKNTAIAIVPDGPRGPKYHINGNIAHVASKINAPIVPVAYHCKRSVTFNSWDNFILPLPFNNILFIFGTPIKIEPSKKELSNAELKKGLDFISQDRKCS